MKQLGIHKHVHFIGFQEDTPVFLKQMDCFCLSSISEGFSIATLEAMASDIPIVATKCGGPEEILSHEITGLLVPPANPEALAQGLLRLLENPALSQLLAQQAKKHLLNTFTDFIMFSA
ncbi:MAG: glycosyltransferase family 4 protein, partial [Flammeovirgaceae bacterium]